jgi:hypothetical protein
MAIEKLARYVPDVDVDPRTGKAGRLFCAEHPDGDYVLYSAARAREDALLGALKQAANRAHLRGGMFCALGDFEDCQSPSCEPWRATIKAIEETQ